MQRQKQFCNGDAKWSPKQTSPDIHFTYWPYQVVLAHTATQTDTGTTFTVSIATTTNATTSTSTT